MKLLKPKKFSEINLFKKIGQVAKQAGIIVIYPALVLFYLLKDKDVPTASKTMIMAALAYFIFPIDSIPDITPIIGYSDDLGVLYVTVSQLIKYITPNILNQVKDRITDWFGEIEEIDNQEKEILRKLMRKMSKNPELEICSNNWLSALAADEAGADRIEICSALGEGGVTPSAGLIIQCVKHLSLKTHVLIRARSGDFLYNEDEIEIMKNDVLYCKENGVDGVVLGFLNPDGSIDKDLTKSFVELAQPMKVTFHRAFDMCKDPLQALKELIELNIDYILTSGQQSTALEGAELLAKLVEQAKGRIKIMAASGVRAHLLDDLMDKTNVDAYHLSSRTSFASGMAYKKTTVGMGSESMDEEYKIHTQDIDILKEAKDILDKKS